MDWQSALTEEEKKAAQVVQTHPCFLPDEELTKQVCLPFRKLVRVLWESVRPSGSKWLNAPLLNGSCSWKAKHILMCLVVLLRPLVLFSDVLVIGLFAFLGQVSAWRQVSPLASSSCVLRSDVL
jgi:hypothetical protein